MPAATPRPADSQPTPVAESARNILQVFGILGLVGLFSLILYKAFHDVGGLARLHPGEDFWSALGRYLLANLAS